MGHTYIESVLTGNERLIFLGEFPWIYKMQAWLYLAFGAGLAFLILMAGLHADSTHTLKDIFRVPNFGADIANNGGFVNAVRSSNLGFRLMAFMFLVAGVSIFSKMLINMLTTEIGVTNYRLIYKTGIIARNVGEMNLNRVESLHVSQSILGRILNYGQVEVRGMGVGDISLPALHDPLSLRRAIEVAVRDRTTGEGRP